MRNCIPRKGVIIKIGKVCFLLYLVFTVKLILKTYWPVLPQLDNSQRTEVYKQLKSTSREVLVKTTSTKPTTSFRTTSRKEFPRQMSRKFRTTKRKKSRKPLKVRQFLKLRRDITRKNKPPSDSARFRRHDLELRREIQTIMRAPVQSPSEFMKSFLNKYSGKIPNCKCSKETCNMSAPYATMTIPMLLTTNYQYGKKRNRNVKKKPIVPRRPSGADININVSYDRSTNVTSKLKKVVAQNPQVHRGGRWWTSSSEYESMAIIIPFRDRWHEVSSLLAVLHPLLKKQNKLCYQIFIVEQNGHGAFNKGRLNNAAVMEISKYRNFNCFLFHDADVIPVNSKNFYRCPSNKPLHMVSGLDIYKYKLPYKSMLGGALVFTKQQYFLVNGYSNLYWGWGLEDDDMELRLKKGPKFKYDRVPQHIGLYKSLPHIKQKIYKVQAARRKALLSTSSKRYAQDGLNSVKYKLISFIEKKLFTHIIINVGKHPHDFIDFNED